MFQRITGVIKVLTISVNRNDSRLEIYIVICVCIGFFLLMDNLDKLHNLKFLQMRSK